MKGILAILYRSKLTILYRLFMLALLLGFSYIMGEYIVLDINQLSSIYMEVINDVANNKKELFIFFVSSLIIFNIGIVAFSDIKDAIFISLYYSSTLHFFQNNKIKLEQQYVSDFKTLKEGDILKYSNALKRLRKIKKTLQKNNHKEIDEDFFVKLHHEEMTRIQDELQDFDNIGKRIIKHIEDENKLGERNV